MPIITIQINDHEAVKTVLDLLFTVSNSLNKENNEAITTLLIASNILKQLDNRQAA
jgi:hypothetical protein